MANDTKHKVVRHGKLLNLSVPAALMAWVEQRAAAQAKKRSHYIADLIRADMQTHAQENDGVPKPD